jgi:hypothetical protein
LLALQKEDSYTNPQAKYAFFLNVEGVLMSYSKKFLKDKETLKNFLEISREGGIPIYLFSDNFCYYNKNRIKKIFSLLNSLDPKWPIWNYNSFETNDLKNLNVSGQQFTIFTPSTSIVTVTEGKTGRGKRRNDLGIRWIHRSLDSLPRTYYFVDDRADRCHKMLALTPPDEISDLRCLWFQSDKK